MQGSLLFAHVLSLALAIGPGPARAAPDCTGEPLRTTGTTHFVCDCQEGAAVGCVAGSDANPGTTKAAPWQTWSKAMATFKTMKGGDTIAFCRGGAWNSVAGTCANFAGNGASQDKTILNAHCSAARTCDWRDYDPSPVFEASAKPLVRPADGVELFAFGRSRFNRNGYTATPVSGFRVFNLDLAARGNGQSRAFFVYGKTEDLEICGMTIRDGFENAYAAQTTSTIKRVRFHHNRVTNNPFGIGPIRATSCAEDCTFDANFMDLNGGATNRDHSIYVGSTPDPAGQFPDQLCGTLGCYVRSQRTRISNNEIHRSAHGPGSACNGVAIVVHEPHVDLVIENNLIHEIPGTATPSCFGIQLSSGGNAPGSQERALVRRNQIYNVGDKGIAISECADCVVEDNLVVGGITDTAIVYPEESYTRGPGSTPSARGTVRNNTAFAPPGNSTMRGGIKLNFPSPTSVVEGSGYVASNNAVCGTHAAVNIGPGVTSAGNRVAVSCPLWFVLPSTDPASADFRPRPGSPLLGGADPAPANLGTAHVGAVPWSPADAGRPPGAPPDVGAYSR